MLQLVCAATILILPPGEKANKLDMETVTRAKVRCGQLFKESPCAVKVERRGKNSYRVYCGRERGK